MIIECTVEAYRGMFKCIVNKVQRITLSLGVLIWTILTKVGVLNRRAGL